jgi:hypothetical protein
VIGQGGSLFHDDGSAEFLHSGNDLFSLLLRYRLLHHLGGALDKLLAVHKTETKNVLDLLDDLGLGACVEGVELEGEERLLLGGGRGLVGLFGGSGGGGRGSSEAANGQVGDVETRLQEGLVLERCGRKRTKAAEGRR